MSHSSSPQPPISLIRQLNRKMFWLNSIAMAGLGGVLVLSLVITLNFIEYRLEKASNAAVKSFESLFFNIKSDLLATSAALTPESDIKHQLRLMRSRNREIQQVQILSPDGKILASSGVTTPPLQLSEDVWPSLKGYTNQIYISPLQFYDDSTAFVDVAAITRNRLGISQNLLAIRLDLTEFWRKSLEQKVGRKGYVYLADKQNRVVAADNLNWLGKTFPNHEQINEQQLHICQGLHGQWVFSIHQPLTVVPWYVIVEIPITEALIPFILPSVVTLTFVIIGVLILVRFRQFTQQRLVQPLAVLNQGVIDFKQGNLINTINLQSSDELGQLAATFNEMAAQIDATLSDLEKKVEERTIELVETNQQLMEAKTLADAANQAKSQFIANMSHEIRTPMNAILGFTDLLSKSLIDSKSRYYLDSIRISGQTLMALINDILDLSKIEAGKLDIHPELTVIRGLIVEIKQLFLIELTKKQLYLQMNLDPSLPEVILIDKIRLRQILLNIVGNAIKFTETGGVTISVTATTSKYNINLITLILTIQDTGIGIPLDQQKRVFQAFTQQERQSSRKYGGTGLGLTITQRLTNLLEGEMTLKSEVNQGTTFTFQFPNIPVVNLNPNNLTTVDSYQVDQRELSSLTDGNLLQVSPQLLQKIEQEEENYQQLCQLMTTKGIRNFSQQLEQWGQEYSCQLLLDYADLLLEQLQKFDADQLSKTLLSFTQIRKRLQTSEALPINTSFHK